MIVLDTHAWLWWADDPERLSEPARAAIDAAPSLGIPAICCWELATLASRRRLDMGRSVEDWVRQALAHPRAIELPLTGEIAVSAGLLEQQGFHPDPADRIVYATARSIGARLISADRAIRAFDPARVVW